MNSFPARHCNKEEEEDQSPVLSEFCSPPPSYLFKDLVCSVFRGTDSNNDKLFAGPPVPMRSEFPPPVYINLNNLKFWLLSCVDH